MKPWIARHTIMVLIEEVSPDRGDALVQGVLAVLADVHAAVDDHQAMRLHMAHTLEELDRFAPSALRGQISEDLEFLRSRTELPIALWDERLSTAAVTRTLLDADASRRRRGEVVDKMAAAYILQGALERLRRL